MRSTSENETKEIADARAALQRARRGLAQAQRDADEEERETTGVGPPPSSPLTDAADTQWVRVALLERRERDAVTAHARGDRRRGRTRRWRRIFGLRSTEPADPAPAPTVHEATMSFLDQPGEHDTAEDMHPSVLDPVQADLQDALSREALAKKNAERDARDA